MEELVKKYEEALKEILSLRDGMEYVDEWQEAAAFQLAEEIAKKALERKRECFPK